MGEDRDHKLVRLLEEELASRRLGRREFLRMAGLLGLSAATAYGLAGKILGGPLAAPAMAQAALPKGGTLRIAMPCLPLKSPHRYSRIEAANSASLVYDYLTVTGADNVTRPSLCERWEASEDLRSWTLHLRTDVKWHDGRPFTADDVIWNLTRVLDPQNGSPALALFRSFLLVEYRTGESDARGNAKTAWRLWDANALERLDDNTVRLNGRAPQLAVPEALFHHSLLMLDPEGDGIHKVGAVGTGPFTMVEDEEGRRQIYRPAAGYWGTGPNVEEWQYLDPGETADAAVKALAEKRVDGLYSAELETLDALSRLPDLVRHEAASAYTAVARMRIEKPFDDKRVRQALRHAIDPAAVLAASCRGLGMAAEHHHVAPIHPDYAKLPPFPRDVAKARQLLAEAGYPGGLDLSIAVRSEPAWERAAVEAMAAQWQEASIRVKLDVMPSARYWDEWTRLPFGFTSWAHRPLGTMALALAYRSGVPWNESGYSNPEFDALLASAEGILKVEERRAVMAKLEAILQDDGPIVQPVWRSRFTFMDRRVQGFRMHPTGHIFGNELAIAAA